MMDQEPEGSATVEKSLDAVLTDSTEAELGVKETEKSNCVAEKEEKEEGGEDKKEEKEGEGEDGKEEKEEEGEDKKEEKEGEGEDEKEEKEEEKKNDEKEEKEEEKKNDEKEEKEKVEEKKEENEKEDEKKHDDKEEEEEEEENETVPVTLPPPQDHQKEEENEEKDSESVSKGDLENISSIRSPPVEKEGEEEEVNIKENAMTEEKDVSKLVEENDNIESKNDEEIPVVAANEREESIVEEKNEKEDLDKENSTSVPLQEEESFDNKDRDTLTQEENLDDDDDNNLRKRDSATLEDLANIDRDSETNEENFGDACLTRKDEDSSDSTLIDKGDELRDAEIGSKLPDRPENEGKKIEKEGKENSPRDEENVDEVEKRCDKTDDGENDVKKSSTGIIVSDSSMDCQEKESTVEKNAVLVEPENTEFVQISQEDKHDESQIENQSIDNAEDPFGGDNLTAENLDDEQMIEGENLAGEIADFQKLGDQADNLQAVVKAKDKSKDVDFGSKLPEKNNSGNENTTEEGGGSVTLRTELSAVPENEIGDKESDKRDSAVENLDKDKSGSEDRQKRDKEDGKIEEKEGMVGLETDEVLPGQDDELCIIPDSMKVILPEETTKAAKTSEAETTESVEITEKDIGNKEIADKKSSVKVKKKVEKEEQSSAATVPEKPVVEKLSIDHTRPQKKYGKDTTKKAGTKSLKKGIINLDEEPKKREIEEIHSKEKCKQCNEVKSCKLKVKVGSETFNVCSKDCRNIFKTANNKATDIPSDGVNSKREKRCACCLLIVESNDERNLSWETMEFCNEECLGKFQTKYGSYCRNCNGSVQAVSLGKYCVRFGYDVRQFCCSTCLEEFKKGLKVCSYCQKDISSGTEGFLAPVGDKGQFKDFCTQDCMEKYSRMSSSEPPVLEKKSCSVCQEEKIVHCEVQINGGGLAAICSDPCFAAFKFVNKVDPDQCSTCKKFFQLLSKKNFVVFYEGEAHMFCNKTCLNVFIITNRKIVPCNWCKVKKYNFDMIKKELKSGQVMMMCSLNCLTLYQVSINAVSARRINCDFCKEFSQAQYHLTMSDATIRNFCSYKCVMNFQSQYTKSPITIPSSDDPVPTGIPKRTILQQRTLTPVAPKPAPDHQTKSLPVISSVTSLATIGNGQSSNKTVQNCNKTGQNSQQNSVNNLGANVGTVQSQPPQIVFKQQIIARPPSPVKVHNRVTQCKPLMHTKGVSVRPHPCTKSTQTDDNHQIVVPIPVPIYVPYPMHMYSMPFPVPFPFPLPIPVPIFIPTTRNSAKGIFKDIKRIQEKIPADPFEAELLMMAEMVATEKKPNDTDSDSDDDNRDDVADVPANPTSDGFSPEGVDSSNTFGDDMLQMALKMATGELDEPAVDLEAALTPNTITATQAPPQQDAAIDGDVQPESRLISTRGRKRMVSYKPRSTPSKRGRRLTGTTNDIPLMPPPESQQPPPQPRIMEPIEKPDANMALKYTFGVNAWRQWVVGKNAELEKQNTQTRRVKLFKTELLQLTADELNYSLCLFVKEVRKPNGAEYAPDTIYYLCLGIQQYLFENNRIDNIFTDSYYEKFTDCLNEVAKKFSVLYNDAQYIVTRVEEEHLWESKQLGAHSPHVLLSTLMFFNTKHFNLVTVDEHMQLSFSHIMKHWKRNPAAQPAAVAGKVPGSRNVLLRFYPPQSALEANSRKKKVYEQQENEENPLRCPVKLYEFYLSKCPESVKTRNDVFYLLPERSCVPDSPVWYSTSPLAKEQLIKMLYRVKMVKEINVALLTS